MMVLNPRVEIYLLDAHGPASSRGSPTPRTPWFATGSTWRRCGRSPPTPARSSARTPGARAGASRSPRLPSRSAPSRAGCTSSSAANASTRRCAWPARATTSGPASSPSPLAVGSALVVGLVLFFLLTHRLAALADAVAGLRGAATSAGASPPRGRDEIGDLGRAFNAMASAVETGMQRLRESEPAAARAGGERLPRPAHAPRVAARPPRDPAGEGRVARRASSGGHARASRCATPTACGVWWTS